MNRHGPKQYAIFEQKKCRPNAEGYTQRRSEQRDLNVVPDQLRGECRFGLRGVQVMRLSLLFFLHPLFIELFSRNSLVTPLLARESWPMYFAGCVLCVGTCCALALWAKRVFGPRSRFLTGY